MLVKISEIRNICITALLKNGVSKKNAIIIFDEYLYGELSGKKSHGLQSFPKLFEKLKAGKGKWKIEKQNDVYALINGNSNLGQLVGKYAMGVAVQKAKKKGISIVGIHNMQSYLMPGYYAKMAAEENMISIVVDNSVSRVVPYGGIDPKLGPSPIGIAIPNKDNPIILDMATSVRAMGEVRLAKKLNKPLPEGVALDKDGNPTTDPEKVNSLLPFGGYKGYGLCLAIEILAGSLVRAKMGSKIQNGSDRGYLFIVIDPKLSGNLNSFKSEVSALIKEVKSSKKQKGVNEILIPGEAAQRKITLALKNGCIQIPDKIIEEIRNL